MRVAGVGGLRGARRGLLLLRPARLRGAVLRRARRVEAALAILDVEFARDLGRGVLELADALAEAARDLGDALGPEDEKQDEKDETPFERTGKSHGETHAKVRRQ